MRSASSNPPFALKRTSLTSRLMRQTSSLFQQANSDPNVRVVILSARGKAFSSGLDRTISPFSLALSIKSKTPRRPLYSRQRTPTLPEPQKPFHKSSNSHKNAPTASQAAQNRNFPHRSIEIK